MSKPRSAAKSESAETTLETLAQSVESLPGSRQFNALKRSVEHLLWAVEQLGTKGGLDLSQDAYKTHQADEKAERGSKPAPHLELYRKRFETVKEEMAAASGTAPSRDEVTAECRRRKEAGEAPFDSEPAGAAVAAPKPAKAAPKSGSKPAAKAPAAKPAAKAPAAKPKA